MIARPEGNGGKTDKYVWTQSLKEVQVFIDVVRRSMYSIGWTCNGVPILRAHQPPNLRGKDLDVRIKPKSLYVAIKGQEPIVDVCFNYGLWWYPLTTFSEAHSLL